MNRNFRIAAVIAYDGSQYYGFARQKNKSNTIQEVIERRLSKFFKQTIKIVAAGRTDKHVHANGQVISFLITADPKKINFNKILIALNQLFPADIYVKKIKQVKDSFHVIKDVKKKKYVYKINFTKQNVFLTKYYWFLNQSELINLNKMDEVINLFIGRKNFFSFSHKAKEAEMNHTIKEVIDIKYKLTKNELVFFVYGSGFTRYMVRNIIGLIIEYLQDKTSLVQVNNLITVPTTNRMYLKAIPNGLYLDRVYY